MKQLATLICAFLLMGSSAFAWGDQNEKEVRIQTSAKCKMCKMRLERNLGLSKGVTSSELRLEDKVMVVKYDPKKTSDVEIRNTILKTGYDADGVVGNQKSHDKLPKCCRKTAEAH